MLSSEGGLPISLKIFKSLLAFRIRVALPYVHHVHLEGGFSMKSMSRGLGLILVMALLPAFSLASSAVDAGSVSDGPQQWAAAPYWSPPSVRAGGRDALFITSPKPLPFIALEPCRVADTRVSQGFLFPYGAPWLF